MSLRRFFLCFYLAGLAAMTSCGSSGQAPVAETAGANPAGASPVVPTETSDTDTVSAGTASPTTAESGPASQIALIPKMNQRDSVTELGVADYTLLNFDDAGSAIVDFNGIDPTAEYYLVLQSGDLYPGKTTVPIHTFELGPEQAAGPAKTVHGIVSAEKSVIKTLPNTPVFKKVDVGNIPITPIQPAQKFRVPTGSAIVGDFEEVSAHLQCNDGGTAIYLDDSVIPGAGGDMTADDIGKLCATFPNVVGQMVSLFGALPDINHDQSVVILLSPVVNQGSAGNVSFTLGFFAASDMVPYSTQNAAGNEREIIYLPVPDPNGKYGKKINKDHLFRNYAPTIGHELQHLFSFYNHVVIAEKNVVFGEESWLDEGLSHLTEDVLGYNVGNPAGVDLYIAKSYLPIYFPSLVQDDVALRGGYYLFLRYLYEQNSNPGQFLKDLILTELTGINNIATATANTNPGAPSFLRALLHYGIALAVSSKKLTSDNHFTFSPPVLNTNTGGWSGICLSCDYPDGNESHIDGPAIYEVNGPTQIQLFATGTQIVHVTSAIGKLSVSVSPEAVPQAALVRFK